MRKWMFLTVLPVLLLGCGNGPLGPDGQSIRGLYLLNSIDGQQPPFLLERCASSPAPCESIFHDAQLTISSGEFGINLSWTHEWPESSSIGTSGLRGEFSFAENTFEFEWKNPESGDVVHRFQGTLGEGVLTIPLLPLADNCCDPFLNATADDVPVVTLVFEHSRQRTLNDDRVNLRK